MALRVIMMRRKLSQLQNALIVWQADASWFVTPDLVQGCIALAVQMFGSSSLGTKLRFSGFVVPGFTRQRLALPRRWRVFGDRHNPSAPERPDHRHDCGAPLPAGSQVGL